MRSINLRHLEGVAAIRRVRSFSTAAAEINLTQSALTQAVAGLERRIGRRLFDRGAAGARPTSDGNRLADSIDRALMLLNDAGRQALPSARSRAPLTSRATATQLLALAAVERTGSFRAAARDAGLTEASIHRSVRDLEASIGLELIAATHSGTLATPAAAMLARATRQAMADLAAALDAAARGGARRLAIGAMPLIRAGLLPSVMAQFCRADPEARLLVVEGAYGELLTGLLDGRLDMLLGALREDAVEGAVQRPLFEDELVMAARHDHPLARSAGWPAVALRDYPWIASPAGTPRRIRWEEMLRNGGVEPPDARIECSSASAARGLLLQGEWLAMLSPDQFRIERELGLIVPLGGPLRASSRAIGITTRAGWIPDGAQAMLLDILQRSAAGQAPAT